MLQSCRETLWCKTPGCRCNSREEERGDVPDPASYQHVFCDRWLNTIRLAQMGDQSLCNVRHRAAPKTPRHGHLFLLLSLPPSLPLPPLSLSEQTQRPTDQPVALRDPPRLPPRHTPSSDVSVVYWNSFSNHHTKSACTRSLPCINTCFQPKRQHAHAQAGPPPRGLALARDLSSPHRRRQCRGRGQRQNRRRARG